jgi:hypothetical protein
MVCCKFSFVYSYSDRSFHSSIHSFINFPVCSEIFLTPTFYNYYFLFIPKNLPCQVVPTTCTNVHASLLHFFIHLLISFIHSFCYILQVTSDSSLSVIAQTFMDSCSLNENILGKWYFAYKKKLFRSFQ